jgi:AbiV family abortive infection protein
MEKNIIKNFKKSITVVLENGDRLADDAKYLFEYDRFPSAYALCILAQEEYAKAFFLYLISEEAIPWTKELQKMLYNHSCKQLLSLIIDFLEPDDFGNWMDNRKSENYKLPCTVADAINILRHEKLPQQGQWAWLGDDDPPCDRLARKVADGKIDQQKQDALYVGLGNDGNVTSIPSRINKAIVSELLEKTQRFSRFLFESDGKIKPIESIDYIKIFWTFKLLFGLCTIDEYEKQWWV